MHLDVAFLIILNSENVPIKFMFVCKSNLPETCNRAALRSNTFVQRLFEFNTTFCATLLFWATAIDEIKSYDQNCLIPFFFY